MTLIPMYMKCPKCKKTYSWNPDVGKISCPRCGQVPKTGMRDVRPFRPLPNILHKKKKK